MSKRVTDESAAGEEEWDEKDRVYQPSDVIECKYVSLKGTRRYACQYRVLKDAGDGLLTVEYVNADYAYMKDWIMVKQNNYIRLVKRLKRSRQEAVVATQSPFHLIFEYLGATSSWTQRHAAERLWMSFTKDTQMHYAEANDQLLIEHIKTLFPRGFWDVKKVARSLPVIFAGSSLLSHCHSNEIVPSLDTTELHLFARGEWTTQPRLQVQEQLSTRFQLPRPIDQSTSRGHDYTAWCTSYPSTVDGFTHAYVLLDEKRDRVIKLTLGSIPEDRTLHQQICQSFDMDVLMISFDGRTLSIGRTGSIAERDAVAGLTTLYVKPMSTSRTPAHVEAKDRICRFASRGVTFTNQSELIQTMGAVELGFIHRPLHDPSLKKPPRSPLDAFCKTGESGKVFDCDTSEEEKSQFWKAWDEDEKAPYVKQFEEAWDAYDRARGKSTEYYTRLREFQKEKTQAKDTDHLDDYFAEEELRLMDLFHRRLLTLEPVHRQMARDLGDVKKHAERMPLSAYGGDTPVMACTACTDTFTRAFPIRVARIRHTNAVRVSSGKRISYNYLGTSALLYGAQLDIPDFKTITFSYATDPVCRTCCAAVLSYFYGDIRAHERYIERHPHCVCEETHPCLCVHGDFIHKTRTLDSIVNDDLRFSAAPHLVGRLHTAEEL